jgi:hypothetical protein
VSERFRIVHLDADGRRAFGIDGTHTAEAARRAAVAARNFLLGSAAGLLILGVIGLIGSSL